MKRTSACCGVVLLSLLLSGCVAMFIPTPSPQCMYWLDVSNSGGISWEKEFVKTANLDDLYAYFMCKVRFPCRVQNVTGTIAALRGKEFAIYLMNKVGSVDKFEKIEIILLLNDMCKCGVYKIGDNKELLEAVHKSILQEEEKSDRDWLLTIYEKLIECTGDNFPSEMNMNCGK